MILKPKHAPLQDTNDHFLANLQKDGTYSIRAAGPGRRDHAAEADLLGEGGEEVSACTQDHRPRSASTWFGARRRAAAPHLEGPSGGGLRVRHAYGSAAYGEVMRGQHLVPLRRAGLGVDGPIALENRYRGIRSPHKLRWRFSGCTRECAEAQGKDVGVIATEKGWNLLRLRQRRQ